MEHAPEPRVLDQLSDLLDLPPSLGGTGLHPLMNSADEKFLGSFASICSTLISFCKKTNLQVYIRMSKALGEMDSPPAMVPMSATVHKVREASNITLALAENISATELETPT